MAITVACDCGKQLRVGDENAGRRVKCPACGKTSDVPGPDSRVSPPPDKPSGVPIWLAASTLLTMVIISGVAFFLGTRFGARPQAAATLPSVGPKSKPDVVEAKEFRIVGVTGRVRGKFFSTNDGVGMQLLDEKGVERGNFSLIEGHIGLNLMDEGGKSVGRFSFHPRQGLTQLSVKGKGKDISLLVNDKGDASIGLNDQDGTNRSSLSFLESGMLSLDFKDRKGQPLAFFSANDDGKVVLHMNDSEGTGRLTIGNFASDKTQGEPMGIQLSDQSGNRRAMLSSTKDGSAMLTLHGPNKRARAAFQVLPEGDAMMSLSDGEGAMRLMVKLQEDSPAILLFDKNKKPRGALVLDPEGNPFLQLIGPNGEVLGGLPVEKPGRR